MTGLDGVTWDRWWFPAEQSPPLVDGLLIDSSSVERFIFGSEVEDLTRLADRADLCLILLGDPGLGKTHELNRLVKQKIEAEEAVASFDLGSFTDWDSLSHEVFNSETIVRWSDGEGNLLLVLDGLDEALAIRRLPEELHRALARLDTGRLLLRIAGRPSVWPRRLTALVTDLWPSTSVLTLAPLTKTNIQLAAESALGTETDFLTTALSLGLGPLIANPIVLGFLLSIAQSEGGLPAKRSEVYQKGIEILIQEHSDRRIDERTDGPSVDRRLMAGETLAALSLLAGRPRVTRRSDTAGAGTVTISTLSAATGDEVASEAVWNSAVLAGVEANRVWYHRSVAEYLAAVRLASLPFDSAQRLLAHPFDVTRITPQHAGVAVWLAGVNSDAFEWVASVQPDLLLTSDLGNVAPLQRRMICQAILAELGQGEVPSKRRSYQDLSYPEMGEDLAPLIFGAGQPLSVRVEALRMLYEAGCRDLDGRLLELVEEICNARGPDDYDDEVLLAEWCLRPMLDTGDQTLAARIEAIAGATGFPRTLRLQVITLLVRRRQLIGAQLLVLVMDFVGFTTAIDNSIGYLIQGATAEGSLTSSELAAWLVGNADTLAHDGYPSLFEDLAVVALTSRAINEASEPELDVLGQLIARCISSRHQFPGLRYDPDEVRQEARRRLTLAALVALDGGDFHSAHEIAGANLIDDDDLRWWLEVAGDEGPTDGPRLRAARTVVSLIWPTPENAAIAFEVARQHSELADIVEKRFGSGAQANLVASQAQWAEQAIRQRSRDEERRFSSTRLDQAIAAEHWPNVLRELCRPIEADEIARPPRGYSGGESVSSRTTWSVVPAAIQETIGRIACVFLETPPDHIDAFGADAACAAYNLLMTEYPEVLASVPVTALEGWLPSALRAPEQHRPASRMLAAVAAVNPSGAEGIVSEQLTVAPGGWVHILDRLAGYANPVVTSRILELAADEETHPRAIEHLLAEGFANEPDGAAGAALTVIARRGAAPSGALVFEDKASWPYQAAIGAAVASIHSDVPEQLLRDLIVIFESDPEFGRRVMTSAGGQFGRVPVLPNARCQILADYYLWARRALPPAPVFRPDRAAAPSAEQHLRELILQRLIACTGTDALAAIERVAQITGDPHLRGQARAALHEQLALAWRPPTPADVAAALAEPKQFLVTTASQLSTAVVKAIDQLQIALERDAGERSDYWHRQQTDPPSWIPKSENEISDVLARRLGTAISSLIVHRETQTQPRLADQSGEEPDIVVMAKLDDDREVYVLVEVKGSWHDDVTTAIETQLADRYLSGSRGNSGIYLVAYPHSEKWSEVDRRRTRAKRHSLEELRTGLEERATELNSKEFSIAVRVLDIRLGNT